jgi:hypothetical protein
MGILHSVYHTKLLHLGSSWIEKFTTPLLDRRGAESNELSEFDEAGW